MSGPSPAYYLTCDDLRHPEDVDSGPRPLTRSGRDAPQTPLASSVARHERMWGPKLGSTIGQTVYTFEHNVSQPTAATTTPLKTLPGHLLFSSPPKSSHLTVPLAEARAQIADLELQLRKKDAALAKKDELLNEARAVAKKYKGKYKGASKALVETQARLDEARRVADAGRSQSATELTKATTTRPRRGKPIRGILKTPTRPTTPEETSEDEGEQSPSQMAASRRPLNRSTVNTPRRPDPGSLSASQKKRTPARRPQRRGAEEQESPTKP